MLHYAVAFRSNAFISPWRRRSTNVRLAFAGCGKSTQSATPVVDLCDFQDCWSSTTWSVNPLNDTRVDNILQRLSGPAPQSLVVLNRALDTRQQQDDSSLEHVLRQCTFLVKPGYEFQVRKNEWRIEAPATSKGESDWRSVIPSHNDRNAVELAHEALELAMDASENRYPIPRQEIDALAQEAVNRLALTLGTDIRGRSSADAAFSFAMAGVTDDDLYQTLALVARFELQRTGQRPSFRSKYILQIVEKLAAAGIQNDKVYRVAADCLASKGEHLDVAEMLAQPGGFGLLSARPLLWLWRFSARQPKVAPLAKQQSQGASIAERNIKYAVFTGDWVRAFDDPTLPLVIDVGCGMGVSLLGLASMDETSRDSFKSTPEGTLLDEVYWHDCNYVGGDLSQLCLGYGRGIAQRWELNGKLQYVYGSALALLESVETNYPGNVALVMIQFPTPFGVKEYGNPQLPCNSEHGFMVTKELLAVSKRLLECSHGKLLLQSNCEDVGVMMRDMAENEAEFEIVNMPSPVQAFSEDSDGSLRIPQRSSDWIQSGGKRAKGKGFSRKPLLPACGATETEVSCFLNKTPIHRCLLQPKILN
jgi:hypothetical protein